MKLSAERSLPIRPLTKDDAPAFRALRLAGLQAHPDSFRASWEEEADRPLSWFEDTLQRGYVAGCELDNGLVGVAGLRRGEHLKTKHRGTLWGMYVTGQAQRRGVGAGLVRQVIAEARGALEELNLTVAAHNESAIRLYGSLGFVRVGVDPHALKVGDTYIDEVLMRLEL